MNHMPVLIVEDDAVVALDLELAVIDYGLQDVRTCKSVKDADREITLRAPKVAIIDVTMDCGTQSAEVAGRLIQLDCHVILLANFKEDIRKLPPSLGCCDVIEKPFRDADLRAKLERVADLGLARATSLDVAPNIEIGTG
ncbi:response regulator [Roseovarius atlanticus]|uniref:response regulator n=1 Tax=Roseovarius atlanticus TaxID=1641875 RepID=UPI001C988D53|nr:response regulator [Roseovarius atlanticus]MBY5987088.1 response regulator [Roseovarius atlanticus]MBY6125728.1 response regulator [Roseovarius atlanticus]MBY6149811.1 response regulator [Roseovarius atlanticus]